MKIIDGKSWPLGRLANYAAKESLKGEEIVVVNCEQIIITGNKKNIKEKFEERRRRIGSGQKGPKYPRTIERIVKRAIRGMLPNHRKGRGKEAYKRIKCYKGVPEEYHESQKIINKKQNKTKFVQLKDL